MASTTYSVSVDFAGSSAPANGFIDATTIEQYMAAGSTPSNYANCQAKERANLRVDFIRQQMQTMANIYMTDMATAGADANTAGTAFTFTATVEHGDEVLSTPDETTPGAFITGGAAIKRCIARALMQTSSVFGDTLDPTQATAPGNSTNYARTGIRIEKLVVGAIAANLTAANALITVTKI